MVSNRARITAALGILAEIGLVLVVGLLYVRPFTNFDHSLTHPGKEFLGTSSWIWIGVDSLLDHAELPLWNHYMGTGIPYLGDPFSHLLSPLALMPALFLGPEDGPRLAVPLTIIASGFAQYYFASALGLSAPARVFSALVYMMNGQLAVRFESGVYDFGLAYPYIPLCYALLVKAMTSERGALYPVLGGASIAALMFAGNAYFFVFTMPGLAVTAAFYAIEVRRGSVPALRWHAAWRALAVAGWGFGFSAIQWVPWLATDAYIDKPFDPELVGSPTVLGSLRAFFVSDPAYYASSSDGKLGQLLPEYYAYIGALMIPLFILSPLALFVRLRAYLFVVLLFWFYILFASAAHTPFQYLYEQFPRLYDFRHTSRQISTAMPFAAVIPAMAIDAVWCVARRPWPRLRVPASLMPALAAGVIALFSWFALGELYGVNSDHYKFVHPNTAHDELGAWLRAREGKPFLYDRPDGTWSITPPYQRFGLKLSRPIWGWKVGGNDAQIVPDRPSIQLLPKPRYLILFDDQPPALTGAPIAVVARRIIYEFPDAPPYAGFVRRSDASRNTAAFEVPFTQPDQFARWPFDAPEPATATWPSNNQVRVTGAPQPGQDTLIVLESYFDGWRLEIDGRDAGGVENIGGLIGTPARDGTHTYLFVFDPRYARIGVAITLGTVLGALLWFLQAPLRGALRRLRSRSV